jgi:hemerythrin HHE cation binding domain-containing protein
MSDPALPGWDESRRPRGGARTGTMWGQGRHLVEIHDHYRSSLAQVRLVLARVARQGLDVGAARAAVHQMGLRKTYEQLGSFCGQACAMVEVHHTFEDVRMYPALRGADPGLAPVLDRLTEEHHVVHAVLVALDAELVALVDEPDRLSRVRQLFEHLEGLLLSHFRYEEDELCGPLGQHALLI